MKKSISKLALTATLALAITLTFSCSSGDDENSSSSSSISNGNGNGSSSSVTGGGGSSSSAAGGGSSSGGGSNLCNGDGTTGINGGSGKGNDIANYRTVQIGEQWWMAENLNYAVEGSRCYGECGKVVYDLDPAEEITLSSAEIQANCDKYGRLYDWTTAMALPSKCNRTLSSDDVDCEINTPHQGICPSGWHIPNAADWNALMKVANPACSDNRDCVGAGTKLKATSGWNVVSGIPQGTDEFGFSALPGGSGFYGSSYSYDAFAFVGYFGSWWSATELSGMGLSNKYHAYTRAISFSHEDALWAGTDRKESSYSVRCVKD